MALVSIPTIVIVVVYLASLQTVFSNRSSTINQDLVNVAPTPTSILWFFIQMVFVLVFTRVGWVTQGQLGDTPSTTAPVKSNVNSRSETSSEGNSRTSRGTTTKDLREKARQMSENKPAPVKTDDDPPVETEMVVMASSPASANGFLAPPTITIEEVRGSSSEPNQSASTPTHSSASSSRFGISVTVNAEFVNNVEPVDVIVPIDSEYDPIPTTNQSP
jgi:heme/copper-type cytochrome/quinol oxidase subunit 2